MFLKLPSRIAASCAIVALFSALASCNKHAAATATFTGKVVLHDEFGNALADNGGVTVSLYEDASIQTSTAMDGSFSLSGIPMGNFTLKVEKAVSPIFYGTYYTKITASDPVEAISKPINLGQASYDSNVVAYDWDYSIDPLKQYIIFRGTRRQTAASDNLARYHRIFFNFSTPDGYPNLYVHHYSIGPLKNNLSNGFIDTVKIASLRAKFPGRRGDNVAIASDNPKADSCIIPLVQFDQNGKAIYYPGKFVNSYPAIGHAAVAKYGLLFSEIQWD